MSGIFNGLLVVGLAYQANGNSYVDYANMTGSLFITCVNTFMGTFFGTLNVF
jgi:hypothetical protein